MATPPSADSSVIWMDGELKPFQDATVHVLSHSLHYGSAAFEGIRAYKTTDGRTAIFRAAEHLDRFQASAKVYGAKLGFDNATLTQAMRDVVKQNGFDECYLRPLAWFGAETRGLKLPAKPEMHVAIAAWRWGKYLGEESLAKGIKVAVSSLRRPDVSSSLPWAKLSGNYLNSILARREAALRGCDEALLLDQQGFVAEGSGENLFIVEKGVLTTPPASAILPGITRDAVIALAASLGLQVKEANITRNRLYAAEEAFFTGTAAEVTPIGEVDGYAIGPGRPGEITRKLADLFGKAVKGAAPEFKHWLTYV